jgi:hypothetical protein
MEKIQPQSGVEFSTSIQPNLSGHNYINFFAGKLFIVFLVKCIFYTIILFTKVIVELPDAYRSWSKVNGINH